MDRAKIMGTKNPAYCYYMTTKLPDFRELKEADEVFYSSDKIYRAMENLEKRFPSPEPRGPKEQQNKILQQRRADKIKHHLPERDTSIHVRDFMTGKRSTESHQRTERLRVEEDLLKRQREMDKQILKGIAHRKSKVGSNSPNRAYAKESPRKPMVETEPVDPN